MPTDRVQKAPIILEAADREEWLAIRREKLTASDFAAVLGFDPYRTATEVWAEKTGLIEPMQGNRFTEAGNRLEPVILEWYGDETGNKVEHHRFRLEQHPDLDWLAASRDATATTPTDDQRNVEAKSTGFVQGQRWGDPGTDEVPERNVVQAQGQMLISGLTVTDMPVLITGNDFRIYTIAYDPEFGELLLDRLAEFWRHVVRREQPPIDVEHSSALDLVTRMFRGNNAATISVRSKVAETAWMLEAARAVGRYCKRVEDEAKARILAEMGECSFAEVNDSKVVIERKSMIKNFEAKPAHSRTEIHLKVKGIEIPEITSASIPLINSPATSAKEITA